MKLFFFSENKETEIVGDLLVLELESENIVFRSYLLAFLKYCFSRFNVHISTF